MPSTPAVVADGWANGHRPSRRRNATLRWPLTRNRATPKKARQSSLRSPWPIAGDHTTARCEARHTCDAHHHREGTSSRDWPSSKIQNAAGSRRGWTRTGSRHCGGRGHGVAALRSPSRAGAALHLWASLSSWTSLSASLPFLHPDDAARELTTARQAHEQPRRSNARRSLKGWINSWAVCLRSLDSEVRAFTALDFGFSEWRLVGELRIFLSISNTTSLRGTGIYTMLGEPRFK